MVETNSDRLLMLNDFGVDVQFGGHTFKGIFDSPHNPIDIGGEVAFSIQESSVFMRTSDTSGIVQGSSILVDSRRYVVTDIQPDGTGMTNLVLEAQ